MPEKYDRSLRSAALLASLILLGLLGNYFRLTLFFGVDFLFGGIAILIILYLYGLGWGMFAALLINSYTLVIWGHPYALLVFTAEAAFVGLALRWQGVNLLLAVGAFWFLLGMPAGWVIYHTVLDMDSLATVFVMLKQSVNGIFNALVASLILNHSPLNKLRGCSPNPRLVSLQETLFNLLVTLVLLPSLVIMILASRQVMNRTETEILTRLEDLSTDVSGNLHSWYQQHLQAVTAAASLGARAGTMASKELQQGLEILVGALPGFHNMYVANAAGTTIAFYPPVNSRGEPTLGLNFADRPYFKELKLTYKPVLSEVFKGRGGVDAPIATLSVPIMKEGRFQGYALGALDLRRITDLLKLSDPEGTIGVTLLDASSRVIASTIPGRPAMEVWKLDKTGMIRPLNGAAYQWLPSGAHLTAMTRWQNSLYVAESLINNDMPWKLVIEIVAAPYRANLFAAYVRNLAVMLGLALTALLLALAVSRWIARPLVDLAQVTTNLPGRLLAHQSIAWPASSAAEIHSLIDNSQSMAQALEGNFQELQDRSATLEQANTDLQIEIRERTRAEAALEAERQKLYALLDGLPAYVYLQAPDHSIRFANRTFREAFGEPRDRPCYTVMVDRETPCEVCHLARVFAGLSHLEYIWQPGDGRIYETYNYPFEDTDGSLLVLQMGLDITARVQVERSLQARNLELTTLHRISEISLETQTGEETFQEIVEEIGRASDFPIAVLEFYDRERQMMLLKAVRGTPVPPDAGIYEVLAAETRSGNVARSGQPIIEVNPAERAEYAYEPLQHLKVRTFVGMPIIVEQRVLGTLSLASPRVVPVEEGFVTFLSSLAQYVAFIIDRQRADDQLRQSEARYRTLVENINLGITLIGSDYRIIMANAEIGSRFQKAPSDIIGKTCYQEFERREGVCPHCPGTKAMRTGKVEEAEVEIVRPDGSRHIMRLSAFPSFGPDGEAKGFIEVTEDVTARKQAEEALRKSEERYRFLAENVRDIIGTMDLELRFTYLSPSIRFLTGYTAEEIMTMPPERILTPPSLALLQKTRTEMLAPPATRQNRSSDNTTLELEYITKAGATVWAEVQITLLRDSQGQPQKLLGVARDITERRRAERALAEQYQFLQLLIDNIPSPVFFKDLNGLYRGCNKALGEFLGRPQEEIIGKTVFEIYPKELADKYLQMDQELFRHPGRQDYEFMMDKHDGARRAFIFTKATFGDSNGKVAGLIGVMTDITERKRSEEELKKANEQLKILVAQSEERNRIITQLREVSEMLQVCQTSEEAYDIIGNSSAKFFPGETGGLYVFMNSKNFLIPVATWGDPPPPLRMFSPEECWAIRSGRVHLVEDPQGGMRCQHVPDSWSGGTLCVPMTGQGEALGMLFLQLRQQIPVGPTDDSTALVAESRPRLAIVVAENIALALANLRLRETLKSQAIRDPLTGLFNRRYLEETMARELDRAKRLGSGLGVIMLDLDHFKEFNDTMGHKAGDALLNALGILIKSQCRGEDIPCRFGGEEFLLLLPGASLEATLARAEKLRRGVKQLKVRYQGQLLRSTTVSLGVALYPDHGSTGEVVIEAADSALYRAKEEGRDRVVVIHELRKSNKKLRLAQGEKPRT